MMATCKHRSTWRRPMAITSILGLVLGLSSCANFSSHLAGACLSPGDERVAGEFALTVKRGAEPGESSHQLLVVNAWQDQQLQFVGFNAVGAKLFEGRVESGQVAAHNAPLYRGPDAEKLVWGLLVHQLRTELAECWPEAEIAVSAGAVTVRRQDTVMLRSATATQFDLPADDIHVEVRRLNYPEADQR